MEYLARIHVKSKLPYFRLIEDKLSDHRRTLFRQTCFGPWLDIPYINNDDILVNHLLQRQCYSDDASFDLPLIYVVNGHTFHFGRRQFCLVTGLKFGGFSFRDYRNGDIPFRNRVFPEKIGDDLKIIDILALIEDEEKFSRLADNDAVRLCLLLSLEVIFMGLDLVSVVDDVYLRLVEDLDAWNAFAWGEPIWRQLYDSIRNVFSKHKNQHLAELERNPEKVPSYSLSGFVHAFKVWILESSCLADRFFTKIPNIIPRALSWSREVEFTQWDIALTGFFEKAPLELVPTKAEVQSDWFAPSNDYIMWYIPRSNTVSIGGLYGEFLKKRSEKLAEKKKFDECFGNDECPMEGVGNPSVIDRVRVLEGICEGLVTLPKELLLLKADVMKMMSFLQNGMDEQERLGKYDEFPGSSSEGEEVVPLNHIPGKPDSLKTSQCLAEDEYLLNGLCNLSQAPDQDGDCQHYKCTYTSKQEDHIIRLVEQRQRDKIADVAELADKRKQAEIQRLYNLREARLNVIHEENKQRKSMDHLTTSSHLKLAIESCTPTKRKYVDVVRPPYQGLSSGMKIPKIEELAKKKNELNPLMIEKCMSVKPWNEDLSRPFNRIDKIFLSRELSEFLFKPVVGNCKFPWCNDIKVDRHFWDALCGFNDTRKGWLVDEHIDLWVTYMWHTRQPDMDWAMVSCYFISLLLQGSMPFFYADGSLYPESWSNIERVFIPLNEPKLHWSLAEFHICSGLVTFYDSQQIKDLEYRKWYLEMRVCLEEKLPVILEETGVFKKRNIDPTNYKISFQNAENVPQQGGLFGDCGVFVCMFLYRLAHRLPLPVEDSVQAALAYREKMIHFYYQHKMFCR